MLDWLVFDGTVFSRKDLLQTDGLPLRGLDKKDPGFVFETGVFVWQERVVNVLLSKILRTDDVYNFEACRFHGADEFLIGHGSFIGDDSRAVCKTNLCRHAVERAQGVGDAQTTMFAMHAVDEEREMPDGGGEFLLLVRLSFSAATVRLAGQASDKGSKGDSYDADDKESPEDFHLIAPFPNKRERGRLRAVYGSRGKSRNSFHSRGRGRSF